MDNKQAGFPPKWPNLFLEWYCRKELLEEIQGDVYELYERDCKINKRRADWRFAWNVLRFFRWKNISKKRIFIKPSFFIMIRSYLLSGMRSMLRHATPSLINILGLSLAIGCAVTIFILEDSYFNLDSMHEKGHRIALVVNHMKSGDETERWARSPYPLADLLRENTSVEKVAQVGRISANVRVGDNVFNERILFANPDFMDIFSFGIRHGDRNCLSNKSQLMLSQEMAIKYFGEENAVGKTLSVKFSSDQKYEFTVGAVLENTPANSSMHFNFLLPGTVWQELNREKQEDWAQNIGVLFVLFKEGAPAGSLTSTLDSYKKIQNQANVLRPVQQVELIPLNNVAKESYDISGSLSWSNSMASMIALIILAIFLTLLASFNYMNIAVATVSTRLKEIGIRKTIGGNRNEIIVQFLVENIVLCFVALIAGTALAYFLLVPAFDELFPVKIAFEISSWRMALLFFGGLLLVIALLSGGYPAFYVSSFNAVKILKGKEKFGSKSIFSKILLTIQFTLSITIMVANLIFIWATYYFQEKDWGYNQEGTIGIQVQHARQYLEIEKEIQSNKNLIGYAGSARHIGKWAEPSIVHLQEKEYSVMSFPIGFRYLETMNLRLKSGRLFNEQIESDKIESAVVTDSFVRKMGWSNPLNQEFVCDSVKRYVVGVVEDFYYDDFYRDLEPVVFTIANENEFRFMVMKVQAGAINATETELKAIWKRIAPDDPDQVFLQNQVFDHYRQNSKANNQILYFVSAVAIFIAAMGLYGLVSYNLTRRLKEFSVRKVFGANTLHIFRLMNGDYLWIVLIAFGAGAPIGAYLMNQMLTSIYPTQIPTTVWPYFISIMVMVLMVGLTISTLLSRVTRNNPTESLRME
jgi:ABC-type antimicrobial peptide transport system permease subunit